ncbi:tyrosine-type recombinase/integrase [Wenyingzhuangia aestuarii]|uniref:tyrosine-type recombinase/integrase n=1 Tax=Wenyingzhuangia aestuarii TaxID=1647582 RepID=UPI00143C449F|nr:tyrosine-type recombinase/integrase [Wenyingzhuangia aestuarii]NJB84153.1 site-specific recombinase XerD [Wenyingzhuangia aestuarii]
MNAIEKTIIVDVIQHKGQSVIALSFVYDFVLKEICKSSGALWSQSKNIWYYPVDKITIKELTKLFKDKAVLDLKKVTKAALIKSENLPLKAMLNEEQKNHLNDFYTYLKGKRFSDSTLKTYSFLVAEYLINKDKNTPIDVRSIEKHAEDVLVPKKNSVSTHRQYISAMKHYLTFINSDVQIDFNALAPRKDKKLPNVLSNNEVLELIRVTRNLKHRICIALIYSSGLRVGELINLRIRDLDVDRQMLKVQSGKGRKDRYVPIANVILPLLHNYLNTYTPKTYLIEGLEEGKQYSAISIRKFLKNSCEQANITKRVTPHTLRHSYATHLLENGTDIRYIQSLLGHSRPETTMIYTQVRSQDLQKITNPLDLIVKQLENHKKIN